MNTLAIVALAASIIAMAMAAWAFIIACDALNKPGRQGPQGFTGARGPMGPAGRPGECSCKQAVDEHTRLVQWANDFERKDNGN